MWHWVYFLSMFLWIDRVCGYLPFVPFTSFIVLTFNSCFMPAFDTQLLHCEFNRTIQPTLYKSSQHFHFASKVKSDSIKRLLRCLGQYIINYYSLLHSSVFPTVSLQELSVFWGSVSYACWYKLFSLWSCHPAANTFSCLQWNVLCVHLHFLSVFSITLRAVHTV